MYKASEQEIAWTPCFDCSADMIESAAPKSTSFVCSAWSLSFSNNSHNSFIVHRNYHRSVHITMRKSEKEAQLKIFWQTLGAGGFVCDLVCVATKLLTWRYEPAISALFRDATWQSTWRCGSGVEGLELCLSTTVCNQYFRKIKAIFAQFCFCGHRLKCWI